MAVFLLLIASFRIKLGRKIVTHREFHYRASLYEPAISRLALILYKPKSVKETILLHVLFFFMMDELSSQLHIFEIYTRLHDICRSGQTQLPP